jgi:hypothetical protein
MNPMIIAALIQAAASIGGGMLSKPGNKETKQQKMSRKTADELLASMKGQGPYSDLFQMDEAAFNKSYVEPAKSRFKNQISPQIQQSYIATGQQRGTGLDDQLLRAGVDLDQMLNEQYMNFQEKGKDRMSNMLGSILGQGAGAAKPMSTGEAFGQSAAGYASSDAFAKMLEQVMKSMNQGGDSNVPGPMTASNDTASATPKGFTPDWNVDNRRRY